MSAKVIKKFKLMQCLSSQMIPDCVQLVNRICLLRVLKHLHEPVTVSCLKDVTLQNSQLGCFRLYQEKNIVISDRHAGEILWKPPPKKNKQTNKTTKPKHQ